MIIPELGLFCLIVSLVMAATIVMGSLITGVKKHFPAILFIRSAVYGQCFFSLLSFITLMGCFLQDNFSVQYVAQNSNTHLPLIYKICAVWGAHEGSLLLWSLILSVWTVAVALSTKKLPEKMSLWVLSILSAINSGFLLLLLFTSNPFQRLLPFAPIEGADLNPLLQDPGFVLHPPLLYMGYVGFTVPFAFALASLIHGHYPSWVRVARPWALLAFGFLTIGISLGSWWAYYELGWGGWWFWDPVENASFMPWLAGAALTHALMISSRKGILISWSTLLCIFCFILSLMGTFLVRSGVLSSVHAFASDPLRGSFILLFIVLVLAISLGLYFWRASPWQEPLKSVFSKEAFILLGNVFLIVATLSILLGTLYPIAMELLDKKRFSVGPPYFNSVFIPLMLPVLCLMIMTPYLHWGKDNWKRIVRKLKKGTLLYLLISTMILAYLWKIIPIFSIGGIILGVGIILSVCFQLKNKSILRRSGFLVAHLGIAISVLGISLVNALEIEKQVKIALGETIKIDTTTFYFKEIKEINGSNYEGIQAHFEIRPDHKKNVNLFPEKRYFMARDMVMTETAIYATFLKDYYIALGEKLSDGAWSVRIYIKPFIRWIWLGALFVALGAIMSAINAIKEKEGINGDT